MPILIADGDRVIVAGCADPGAERQEAAILAAGRDYKVVAAADVAKYKAVAGKLQRKTRAEIVADAAVPALATLDAVAEEHRRQWLPLPGQALTYLEKEAQARAYASAGYSGAAPSLVQAEVDAAGGAITAQQASDAIIAAADAARTALVAIERERRRGVLAIQAAPDAAGVDAALRAAIKAINGIK